MLLRAFVRASSETSAFDNYHSEDVRKTNSTYCFQGFPSPSWGGGAGPTRVHSQKVLALAPVAVLILLQVIIPLLALVLLLVLLLVRVFVLAPTITSTVLFLLCLQCFPTFVILVFTCSHKFTSIHRFVLFPGVPRGTLPGFPGPPGESWGKFEKVRESSRKLEKIREHYRKLEKVRES